VRKGWSRWRIWRGETFAREVEEEEWAAASEARDWGAIDITGIFGFGEDLFSFRKLSTSV